MPSIAIMQPTFMPWIGYFALIDRVDDFIFLDNVQFDKRSWQQRNQIKTPAGPLWLTVPVQTKGQSDQKIKDVAIQYEGSDPLGRIIKSIEHNYKKAPFYAEHSPVLFSILKQNSEKLNDLNKKIIEFLCVTFGIQKQFCDASSLNPSGAKADLLADICEKRGASEYISPPGSIDYLEKTDIFIQKNITVRYHQYNHPEYRQLYGDFIPYMSALDLLFNEGPNSLSIIRSGLAS